MAAPLQQSTVRKTTLAHPNVVDGAQRLTGRIPYFPLKFYTLTDGFQESYSGNNARVRVTYVVDWDLRWELCYYMLGYSEIRTDPIFGRDYLHRTLPQGFQGTHKERFSGNEKDAPPTWLWASSVESIEGVNHRGITKQGAPLFEVAKVTIIYETLSYRLMSDEDMIKGSGYDPLFPGVVDESVNLGRYVTKFVQPSAEYFSLPFGKFKWVTTPAEYVTGAQMGFIIPSMEVVYIWHQIPKKQRNQVAPPSYALPTAVRKMLGSVNNAAFDGFEKGTLLLTSVEVKPYRWIGGDYYSDITYKMKYLKQTKPRDGSEYAGDPRGHNWFMKMTSAREAVPDYEHFLISHDGTNTGIKLYKELDFRELFRIDQPTP